MLRYILGYIIYFHLLSLTVLSLYISETTSLLLIGPHERAANLGRDVCWLLYPLTVQRATFHPFLNLRLLLSRMFDLAVLSYNLKI